MTLDPATAAAVASLLTAIVHVLARIPGWWRQRHRDRLVAERTDADLARELRDELARHLQTLREENTRLRSELAALHQGRPR